MRKIVAKELSGSSVFYKDLHNLNILSFSSNDEISKEAERSIKILLLTKNNIVCPASHLSSENTYYFLKKNSLLLRQSLIIPALEPGIDNLIDEFSSCKLPKIFKKEAISFYYENTNKVLGTENKPSLTWLKDTFLYSLKTTGSVINNKLSALPEEQLNSFVTNINSLEVLNSKTLETFYMKFPDEIRNVLRNYFNLLEDMTEALARSCESSITNEKFIDYTYSDIKNNKTFLNDIQIFWKIFIEIVYETLNQSKIQMEFLDKLDFEDIYFVRQIIQDNDYKNNYNQLFYKSIFCLYDNNIYNMLSNIEELLMLHKRIECVYEEIFTKELGQLFGGRKSIKTRRYVKNSIKYGIGIVPLSDFVNNGSNIFTKFKTNFINNIQVFNSDKSVADYDNNIERMVVYLINMVNKFDLNNKYIIIELIEEIYNSKLSKKAINVVT